MNNNKFYRSSISIVLPIGLLFCIFIFSQWHPKNENLECNKNSEFENKTTHVPNIETGYDKQKGAHVFGILDTTNMKSLTRNNLEWVTLVSWAHQEDYDSPVVIHHNGDSARMRRNDSSWLSQIELVRAAGFKVFLKPHLWIFSPTGGKWRSDIFPTDEKNWELWKNSYRDFILRYAKIAEQANAEMFCIGAEFSRLTEEKPIFWEDLIREVRIIYSGKVTYAANWYQEYEKVTFWDKLDFIGIQAYFPLVENKYPSVDQISMGWSKHLPGLESMHKKYNRKILFTEMGYKSTANSAIKPWEWITDTSLHDSPFSAETQSNCYEAFFNTVWKNDWFAGVHIWHLSSYFVKDGGKNDLDFSPQGKPAENVIAKGFE